MESQTQKQEVKVEKKFVLNSDKNHQISIYFIKYDHFIEISATFKDELLKHDFRTELSFDEFRKTNNYFLLYETIDEIYDDLILLMNKNQTKILEGDESIRISIPIESVKIKEIFFILNEIKKNDKEMIQYLLSFVSDLQKEIKDIKEENKNLRTKINILENYIPLLEDYKKQKEEEKEKALIKNLDSLIINGNKDYNKTLKNWINPNLNIKAELLYRLTRDGKEYRTFHQLCDNKGPTLVLAKLTEGDILGTYTPIYWDSKSYWKNEQNIFVFSLNRKIKAMKKQTNTNYGIYCSSEYGPESYFLCFKPGHKMNEIRLRMDDSEYLMNTKELAPDKVNDNFYATNEVEVFKIII